MILHEQNAPLQKYASLTHAVEKNNPQNQMQTLFVEKILFGLSKSGVAVFKGHIQKLNLYTGRISAYQKKIKIIFTYYAIFIAY